MALLYSPTLISLCIILFLRALAVVVMMRAVRYHRIGLPLLFRSLRRFGRFAFYYLTTLSCFMVVLRPSIPQCFWLSTNIRRLWEHMPESFSSISCGTINATFRLHHASSALYAPSSCLGQGKAVQHTCNALPHRRISHNFELGLVCILYADIISCLWQAVSFDVLVPLTNITLLSVISFKCRSGLNKFML